MAAGGLWLPKTGAPASVWTQVASRCIHTHRVARSKQQESQLPGLGPEPLPTSGSQSVNQSPALSQGAGDRRGSLFAMCPCAYLGAWPRTSEPQYLENERGVAMHCGRLGGEK